MNERIKELALEVFSFKYKTNPNELNPGHHMDHIHKFAELIVRECAHVLMNKQNLSTNQYYQAGWHDAAIYLSSWSRNLDRGAPENGKLD